MEKSRNKKVMDRRMAMFLVAFFVLVLFIILRLFYLQVLKYDDYKNAVAGNIQRSTTISSTRGTIYDRNMVPLATNITTYRVFISPEDIENQEQARIISSFLSETLEVDYDFVYQKTQLEGRLDETIKKNVDSDTADLVREFVNNNGLRRKVYLEATSKRNYPYGTLAASTIGLAGTDQGLAGLELSYDEELTGTDGRYISAKSGNGGDLPYEYDTYIEAVNGRNPVTTIDIAIQNILEKQLKNAYDDSQPLRRATGIVMNPNNGEIYAIGQYPGFNLNSPYDLTSDERQRLIDSGLHPDSDEYRELFYEIIYSKWRNKAITELYEPGSTFKIITTSMALDENVVSFDEEFTCKGWLTVEGWEKRIYCHQIYGHGTDTFDHMLQQSCNPTLMTVGLRIGLDKFYSYFEAFGYTTRTGIDLPGESYGIYHSKSAFNNVELAVYSFGQTFKTTALQQITAVSAVANGGYLVQPHMVSRLVDDNGNVVKDFSDSIKYQVVSSEVCKKISEVLEEGVSGDGGAKNARINGYKIAAKTGTSEVKDDLDEEGNTQYVVCSTVAYAPSDDPQVAVIIVVDEPTVGSLYGSYIAAPYVANVLEEILPYLGIERELVDSSMYVPAYNNTEVSKARANADAEGFIVSSYGYGDLVVSQTPYHGTEVYREGARIVFYSGDAVPEKNIEVPDLKGMTRGQVVTRLHGLGLNVDLAGASGDGTVSYDQSIDAGTLVSEGTVVTVYMMFTSGLTDG